MNCEVIKTEGYRETMFETLPQLKYLDNADKQGGKINRRNIQWKIELI